MNVNITRRDVLIATPAISLSAVVAGCSAKVEQFGSAGDIYRVDDEATIIAAAKAVIEEDYIATLITIDGHGVPRARSVGV